MSVIQLENDTQVSVVWYGNEKSTSFKNFSQPKWSELISRLSIPQNNINKYARGTAVYGDLSDGVDDKGHEYQKYRNDDNVLYRDVLVLDYDDEDDLNMLHKSIKSELEGFAWFWHTTFRHTNESPRIRLYVPLSERISANEYRAYVRTLAQKIACKIDEGSYQPSRAMALPVRKSKESPFEYQFSDAAILDKSVLKEWAKLFDISSKENSTRNFKRRDPSHWQEKAFGVSEGGRNSSLASILGHLFNRRVNEHIIYAFAQMWGQSCTPPMNEREINATFYSIMKKHYNN
ncbi:mobile element-associated protein [Staphylococcus petrasii]|uniref:primase alpha helix C-terminal domain-containing protein n=1 Tax=Staphylococcus petrasii TaxID=1276936 RepID=UPI000CD2E962|nr:primase alpha helix C-terminal domain-containing protein [Staphylococcus petrasii]PNZ81812.1 mobile element-associated protein [Staphylococcus petrasii]TGA80668.1 mobile element-associated protein [Staphylococcus petrasii]SUM59608.1 mobile element-associated protein [Staphylococcus petrasii]